MPVALSSAMVRHAIPRRGFASTPSVIARNVGIAEEISAERMERFFVKVEEGYRVNKAVRDMCVFAQGLKQPGTERDVPIASTLALLDVQHHPPAVDVGDLQPAQLSPAYAGRIERHHHRTMHQVAGRIDQTGHFFLAEHGRQTLVLLRKRDRIGQVRPTQRLDEQEAQRCCPSFDGAREQLAIAKQMDLVVAYMVWSKLLRRTSEIPGEVLNRVDVRPYGVRRIVTALKFVEHQLAKMGHRGILLVTHTLNPITAHIANTAASAAPAA
jgi:hypothetical protein